MMFLPRFVFEKLTSIYDGVLVASRRETELALDRVLTAKDAEVRAVIAAKDEQISFLKSELERTVKLVDRERARAEAAVDALLGRGAEAPPIRHADLQRELAEREAKGQIPLAGSPKDPKAAELERVFRELNAVGEDDGGEPVGRDEKLEIAGVKVAVGV